MPVNSQTWQASRGPALSQRSIGRDLGLISLSPENEQGIVSVRALMMTRVAIVEITLDRLTATIGRGRLRETYPHAICIVIAGSIAFDNTAARVVARAGEVLPLDPDPSPDRPSTYSVSDGFRAMVVYSAEGTPPPSLSERSVPASSFAAPLHDSFVALLESLVRRAGRAKPFETPATARAAEDMTAYIFHSLEQRHRTSHAFLSRRSGGDLLSEALSEIQLRSHDPATDPTSIARCVNISVGHLHRLFEKHSRSVAEEIRLQRTRSALDALSDPRLRNLDLDALATAAGFSSARTMRRAVLEATGSTPSRLRRDALEGAPAASGTASSRAGEDVPRAPAMKAADPSHPGAG